MTISNACPHAGVCGGCQLAGSEYAAQLAFKQRRVESLLAGLCRPEPIVGMEEPFHYRCKVQAAFGYDPRKGVISGIYKPGSHRLVPVERCLLEDEQADAVIQSVRALMPSFRMTAYDERRQTGFLRHVLVRKGRATGQLMAVLVGTTSKFSLAKPFAAKLRALHPALSTVVLNVNDRFGPVVLGPRQMVLSGPGFIEDELCGLTFRLSPRSFFQVNPAQAEKLYTLALDCAELGGSETVLDAYCGVGAIGLLAAGRAGRVLGVEQNADAVHDAIQNAKRNSVENCRFYTGDAGLFMEDLARDKNPADVVFLDPPRSGADERFLASVLRARPKKLVYVSCDPETLSRDLRFLAAGGYKVACARPVDMFPHTRHIETVCLLTR